VSLLPRRFGRIGFVALALAALLLGWRWQQAQRADATVGKQLSAAGRPHLVNLFASWCGPCRVEAPLLADLAVRGVPIEGIAVRDTPAGVRSFLARGNPFFVVRLDPAGHIQQALGTAGLPETYAVDARGQIIDRQRGALTPEAAARLVGSLR